MIKFLVGLAVVLAGPRMYRPEGDGADGADTDESLNLFGDSSGEEEIGVGERDGADGADSDESLHLFDSNSSSGDEENLVGGIQPASEPDEEDETIDVET